MGAIADYLDKWQVESRKRPELLQAELERIKEETYYLVKFEYSDFNITIDGFALLTEKDKEFFDSLNPNGERFYLVSDNYAECIEIDFQDYEEWRNHYTWTSISDEERCIINALIGSRCGYFFYPDIEEEE